MGTSRLGRYDLLAPLGRGGMAEVWRAKAHGASRFSKDVAVKVMLPEFSADPELVAMFIDEACVAAKLEHPNIVHTHDFGRVGDRYFIVLELIDGMPLKTLMSPLRLSQAESIYIVAQIAAALHYAYDAPGEGGAPLRLVHRDVNPSNIMVTVRGTPKLADFGIAKTQMSTSVTVAGNLKGKLAYMSPEQARAEQIDGRSDVYLLGLTLFELIGGTRALRGRNEMELLTKAQRGGIPRLEPHIPTALADIVARSLEPDPAARFPTAGELRDALLPLLADTSPTQIEAKLATRVAEAQADAKKAATANMRAVSAAEQSLTPVTEAATLDGQAPTPVSSVATLPQVEVKRRGGMIFAGVALALVASLGAWRLLAQHAPEPVVAAPKPVITATLPSATPAPAVATTPTLTPAPTITPALPPTIALLPKSRAPSPSASHEPATLRIRVEPWAEISIDGKKIGMTPLRPLEIAPGRHQITAVNPERGKKTLLVRAAPGESKLVQIVFDAPKSAR